MPPDIKCIFCGDEISVPNKLGACQNCLKTLPRNNGKICRKCGAKIDDQAEICLSCFHKPPVFKMARAPFLYDPPISAMVAALKFENAKYLVEPLAEWLAKEYYDNDYCSQIIVPVPLSPARLKQRTYNQALLLSNALGRIVNLPVVADAVERTRNTFPQARLNWRNRQQNMIDAFRITNKSALKNKKILVVDDVMTTGATIKNLCIELQKAKPKEICVLTLAHTYIRRAKLKNVNVLQALKQKAQRLVRKSVQKIAFKLHQRKK